MNENHAALICSQDTLSGVVPSLVLAITARRMGMEAKIFYTFMGINVLKKEWIKDVRCIPPGSLGAIPGMPAVMTWMMKNRMEKAEIPPPEDLLEMATLEGVQLAACKMTVDMMGLTTDDFVDGVEVETAEQFLKYARGAGLSLYT